jgi:hypothetical protein
MARLVSFIQKYSTLEGIVILIGHRHASCKVTFVDVTEASLNFTPTVLSVLRIPRIMDYTGFLREDLEEKLRKWKQYQERREKTGQSSPDWVVPTVRIAYMKEICETSSPYSYRHRCSGFPYLCGEFL